MTFEIIHHGIDSSDYFQGCGTAFTNFENVVTGIGEREIDALDDAIEQASQNGIIDKETIKHIETQGLLECNKTEYAPEDMYWFISVRF